MFRLAGLTLLSAVLKPSTRQMFRHKLAIMHVMGGRRLRTDRKGQRSAYQPRTRTVRSSCSGMSAASGCIFFFMSLSYNYCKIFLHEQRFSLEYICFVPDHTYTHEFVRQHNTPVLYGLPESECLLIIIILHH